MSLKSVFNITSLFCLFLLALSGAGCSASAPKLYVNDLDDSFTCDTIISSELKKSISFETLMEDLSSTTVIYVGEHHTNKAHHDIQLKILASLFKKNPDLVVGLEMFSRPYQSVLDQWSTGKLDRQEFLEKTHWYANWKYDFELYSDLMEFIRENQIPLIALNIPPYITSNIAVGGLDNLLVSDWNYLPLIIDLSVNDHKDYINKIFSHHNAKGRENFDYFYAAQCVWEDSMAEAIADSIEDHPIIVFAGSGHLIRKYGIPYRVYFRKEAPFRTILPLGTERQTGLEVADYIWVSPP